MRNMHFSYSWLKQQSAFRSKSAQAFTDAFAFLGFEPQIIRNDFLANQKVVVAQVLSLRVHPQKPNLTICEVDVGNERQYQVVCGAKNLVNGAKVIFALPNAMLFNGKKISKMNFAGIRSAGMICAIDELIPFQAPTNDIVLLPSSAQIGDQNPLQYVPAADIVWNLEFTFQTRHLSNYFGLTSYLAQYWKIKLVDFPFLPLYQSSKTVFSFQRPKNELIFLVAASNALKLPFELNKILRSLNLFQNNFTNDLNTYFRLFSGCELEFKLFKTKNALWTKTLKISDQPFLVRIASNPNLTTLPPLYRLTTFAYLGKLFNLLKVALKTDITELSLPSQQTLTLLPSELNRISGQSFSFASVKKLFDPHTWTINENAQHWSFKLPLTQLLTDQFELISEIIRLTGYQNLLSQPLLSSDLPVKPALNLALQTELQFRSFWKNYDFIEARPPLQIQKNAQHKEYYQLQNTFLPHLCDLSRQLARPLFAFDTVWEQQTEKQLLGLVLPPLKINEFLEQWKAQTHFFKLIKQLLLEFKLPLNKLSLPPISLSAKADSSLTNLILYQTKNGLQPLAKLGFKQLNIQRNLSSLVPYLTLDYTFFSQILEPKPLQTMKYLPLAPQNKIQQTFAFFDLNLHFPTQLELHPLKKIETTLFKFDLMQLIQQTVMLSDKRIVNVEILDLYKHKNLTIRVFWRISDPKMKTTLQTKLAFKVKNCLKFLKNVKI